MRRRALRPRWYAAAAAAPPPSPRTRRRRKPSSRPCAHASRRSPAGLGDELKERDALSARLREAELGHHREAPAAGRPAMPRKLAAERRRSELRAEQRRDQNALQAERAALAAQVRAAYMIGRQEQIKLLLNQSNPAEAGRMLDLLRILRARARGENRRHRRPGGTPAGTGRRNRGDKPRNSNPSRDEASREMAGSAACARGARRGARGDRQASAAAAIEELARFKREEQAVESLVADLAQVLQDFPVDRAKLRSTARKAAMARAGRVTARYQEPHAGAAQAMRWNGEMIETARGAKVRAPLLRPRGLRRLAARLGTAAHHRTQRQLHDPLRPCRGAVQIGRRLGSARAM